MMTTNGTKYTFVCDPDECDTLIEVTCVSGFDFPNGMIKHTCPCGREMSYISATILSSSQQTKEEQMETTTVDTSSQESMSENYNNYAHMIVKDTTETEMKYKSVTPYDVNVLMTDNQYYKQRLEKFSSKFNLIEENLTEEAWFNPNMEKSDILAELCEILGITPSKTIKFSGTMSFEGSIEVPFDELEDFDLQYLLQDEVYLTSNHGNLEIDSYEVESVSEDY